jgi:hypothetical protein
MPLSQTVYTAHGIRDTDHKATRSTSQNSVGLESSRAPRALRNTALSVHKWNYLYTKLHSYLVSRSLRTIQHNSAATTLQTGLYISIRIDCCLSQQNSWKIRTQFSTENQMCCTFVCRKLENGLITSRWIARLRTTNNTEIVSVM